jgi:endonuclease G
MGDEARLESVRRRLTPELEDRIRKAAAAGALPRALLGALSHPALEGLRSEGSALESFLRVDALEAIVQRFGRPPLLVRNDQVELEPLDDFPPDTDAKIKNIEGVVRSVGRVEFANASMTWGGSGTVVEDSKGQRLVMTNRHVAKIVAKRVAGGRGVFLRSPSTGIRYAANVDFSEEVGTTAGALKTARVVSIEYLADDMAADVALLKIEAEFALPDPIDLADAEAHAGDLVALVGYPAYDSRNDASDQARYFRDLYEVKRFSPGKILQALSGSTTLTHDCTSLGGSSGSGVFSLESGKIVGLHFSGVYGKENVAVGVTTLKALLAGRGRVGGAEGLSASEERPDGAHSPAQLANRDGYDPDFLGAGLQAPWPGLPAEIESALAEPSDKLAGREHELRYTHFGVKYSAERRVPLMTAVNIDGQRSVRIKREGDRWFTDGRISLGIQLRDENFADAQIDRGHMVRREDPNWDDDPINATTATKANFDTFHYTNAAPQHSSLNQGKAQWQGLENYILDSSRTHGFRACVFTGPVLRDDDPDLDGVQVPMEFWKLVVMARREGGLHATAYLLSQGQMVRDLLERRSRAEAVEGFELGDYRTFQIAVRDLAEVLGYDFSIFAAADPLAAKAAAEAVDADEPLVRQLESADDAIL